LRMRRLRLKERVAVVDVLSIKLPGLAVGRL
jgi:hypothetical protein